MCAADGATIKVTLLPYMSKPQIHFIVINKISNILLAHSPTDIEVPFGKKVSISQNVIFYGLIYLPDYCVFYFTILLCNFCTLFHLFTWIGHIIYCYLSVAPYINDIRYVISIVILCWLYYISNIIYLCIILWWACSLFIQNMYLCLVGEEEWPP